MGNNMRQIFFDFHTNATTIGNGEELYVYAGRNQMIIAVTGTATSFI